jgi:hypothetical protein
MHIFSEWFEKGRVLKDEYFKEQSLDMKNPAIEVEFQKYEAWKTKNPYEIGITGQNSCQDVFDVCYAAGGDPGGCCGVYSSTRCADS